MSNDFERQRQDFLWYSYFGITKTDAKKDLKNAMAACIDRAYLDLCRTIKYEYNSTDAEKESTPEIIEFNKNKKKFKSDVRDTIIASIDSLFLRDEYYDEWHQKLSNTLMDIGNNSRCIKEGFKFTYGQAQKWINMTIKNMLVMGLWDFEKYKDCLHVPIDKYIYAAAGTDDKERINDEYDNSPNGLNVKRLKKDWSKIDNYKEEYIKYQNGIRNALKAQKEKGIQILQPIEWEFDAWIAQAKKENNK